MRDRYGAIIGSRARATTASASGMWTLREQMYETASATWPQYDPILSTAPAAYWDFSDPSSLRISGGATSPTPATNNSSVTPQDKSANLLHMANYSSMPTWSTGMQNGKSGGTFSSNAWLYRNGGSFANMHRGQATAIFVFWPGTTGATPPETNQVLFSTNGSVTPTTSGAGFQIAYLNVPSTGPSSALSFTSVNNGTTAAALSTTTGSVPKTRFSIITIVTDIANASANDRVKIYIDGGGASYTGNIASAAAYSLASGSFFFMGSGGSSSFRLGELIFWDTALPASTLNAIHTFLGEYWNIPVTSF